MYGRLSAGIMLILLCVLVACGGDSGDDAPVLDVAPSLTPVPSSTATLTSTPAPTITTTATPEPSATVQTINMELLTSEGEVPPITLDLPPEWNSRYDSVPILDIDGNIRPIQVASYIGPVTGGTGFIVVIWGFSNVNAMDAITGTRRESLWLDGLRFWRLQVNEEGCNIGSDLQRDFTVGGLPAVGTFISAINCPNDPDTAGWFAGLESGGLNFLFYAFTVPREAIEVQGAAPAELQGILNSAQFGVEEWIASRALTATASAVNPAADATPTAESGD